MTSWHCPLTLNYFWSNPKLVQVSRSCNISAFWSFEPSVLDDVEPHSADRLFRLLVVNSSAQLMSSSLTFSFPWAGMDVISALEGSALCPGAYLSSFCCRFRCEVRRTMKPSKSHRLLIRNVKEWNGRSHVFYSKFLQRPLIKFLIATSNFFPATSKGVDKKPR